MSTKRATTRTNARNKDRYLVTVGNSMYGHVDHFGEFDNRKLLTMGASSLRCARGIWKGSPTKRIYRLVSSGRGLK
jgi:hypothetical protein